MAGGFGFSGVPETIIEYVRTRDDIDSLNMISTESGDDDWGLGRLYAPHNKIAKQSLSYIGRCTVMEQDYLSGQTELHLIPWEHSPKRFEIADQGFLLFTLLPGFKHCMRRESF
ncbi:unnamed protein product [Zymoseptoria tritici ST99CH_1A5]|uniref:Uncharacterized protein n=1 Tax=Zymoseptoria tritici ST99CH_1A5 TaxID=1276529 RepID=A0A1Y6L8Q3_ZYMTR|nr:unnamed protein product [Zymoseptoria tritici ST99CH_1A5]